MSIKVNLDKEGFYFSSQFQGWLLELEAAGHHESIHSQGGEDDEG